MSKCAHHRLSQGKGKSHWNLKCNCEGPSMEDRHAERWQACAVIGWCGERKSKWLSWDLNQLCVVSFKFNNKYIQNSVWTLALVWLVAVPWSGLQTFELHVPDWTELEVYTCTFHVHKVLYSAFKMYLFTNKLLLFGLCIYWGPWKNHVNLFMITHFIENLYFFHFSLSLWLLWSSRWPIFQVFKSCHFRFYPYFHKRGNLIFKCTWYSRISFLVSGSWDIFWSLLKSTVFFSKARLFSELVHTIPPLHQQVWCYILYSSWNTVRGKF